MHARLLQLRLTPCDPVAIVLQAGMLKRVAVLSSGVFLTQGSDLCLLCLLHWQVVCHHQLWEWPPTPVFLPGELHR